MKSFSGAVSTSALALLALQASGVSADSAKSFVPSNIRGLFVEQFTPDWESRWTPSQASKFQRGAEELSTMVYGRSRKHRCSQAYLVTWP